MPAWVAMKIRIEIKTRSPYNRFIGIAMESIGDGDPVISFRIGLFFTEIDVNLIPKSKCYDPF